MDPGARDSKVVLVVEDEPDNCEIMRAVVEDLLGYQALLVGDGAAAVEAARTERPNLILMDLMIPVLDGFEAIRLLKSDGGTSRIPVVAITALGRQTDLQKAMESGADDYLSKPFDIDALASVIEGHLSGAPAPASEPG